MNLDSMIVFVCEHGAAKSVLAAAHFNKLAAELKMDLWAIARGTNPDPEISPQTIAGLANDGLSPAVSVPQRLTESEVWSARRVVGFCDLPVELQSSSAFEFWGDVPPVSENYVRARDIIIGHIHQLLASFE